MRLHPCVFMATPQMQSLMYLSPSPAKPGLVFILSGVATLDATTGNLLYWNDSSYNGFDASCEGLELPTFFNQSEAALFSPQESSLDLWLTFDIDALTNNPNTSSYPTNAASAPKSPQYVLDRSGRNRSASINGNVTFGSDDSGAGMSVMSMCYQGVVNVPWFVGKSWMAGFTATVYFKRTSRDRFQSLFGNGFSPQSSFEVRMPPGSSSDADDVQCYTMFEGGSGSKSFAASAGKGQWHFVAISYDPATQFTTGFIDGRLARSESRCIKIDSGR